MLRLQTVHQRFRKIRYHRIIRKRWFAGSPADRRQRISVLYFIFSSSLFLLLSLLTKTARAPEIGARAVLTCQKPRRVCARGSKSNGNPFFPAARTSEKTLYRLQVWKLRVPRRAIYARSRLHTLWQKRPQAFFASLKQLGRRSPAPELFDFCYSPSAAVR